MLKLKKALRIILRPRIERGERGSGLYISSNSSQKIDELNNPRNLEKIEL